MAAAASSSMSINFNQEVTLLFLDVLLSNQRATSFPGTAFDISRFYDWLVSEPYPHESAASIVKLIQEKVSRRQAGDGRLKKNFALTVRGGNPLVEELGSNQVRQLLRTALAMELYVRKERRLRDVFKTLFETMQLPISYLNAGSFLQVVLGGTRQGKSASSAATATPATPFQVLVFSHCLSIIDRKIVKKSAFKVRRNYKTGDRIGLFVSIACKAFKALTRKANLGGLAAALAPYILYSLRTGRFSVLQTRADGFCPETQRSVFSADDTPVFIENKVDETAWGRSDDIDNALRYVAKRFFDVLEALLNGEAYFTVSESAVMELPYIRELDSTGDSLPTIFSSFPEDVLSALSIDRPPETLTVAVGGENVLPTGADVGRYDVGTASTTSMTGSGATLVKQEDVVALAAPAGRVVLSAEEQEAFSALKTEMTSFVSVYDSHYKDLVEVHSEACGEDLTGKVDLVLTDPPYNTRREQGRPNSNHDVLSKDDMEGTVDMIEGVLVAGGHGHIFCSYQQIVEWERVLEKKCSSEDASSDSSASDASMDSDRPSKKMAVPTFILDTTPLHYTRAPGHYKNNPIVRKLTHTSVDEYAVHFWRHGASFSECWARVDYQAVSDTPSSYPGFTNEMNNIPRIPWSEMVFKNQVGTTGRRQMVRPEQKNVSWMKDLVSKFTKPGMTVLDCFAGTLSVGKACLELSQHRRAILCDVDPEVVETSLPGLVLVFANQLLNKDSDIKGNATLLKHAKLYIKAMEGISSQRRVDSGQAPGDFPPFQMLPPHILSFLSSLYSKPEFVSSLSGIPPHKWPGQLESLLHGTNQDVLLAHELCVLNVYKGPSLIEHPTVGDGLFAGRNFAKGEIVGFYYGTLLYVDMDKPRNRNKIIGYGSMAVDASDFSKWALRITHGRGIVIDKKPRHIWIVPARFCAMRFVNDPRYLADEKVPPLGQRRTANAIFEQKSAILRPGDVGNHTIEVVRTIRDVRRGEEFLTDYGNDYIMK